MHVSGSRGALEAAERNLRCRTVGHKPSACPLHLFPRILVHMRTPPPVLPPADDDTPGRYRPTWFDREGPDGVFRLKALGWAAMAFAISLVIASLYVYRLREMSGPKALLLVLVAAVAAAAALYHLTIGWTTASGEVARMVTLPSGASTPYEEQFSYQETLAARGDVAGALESYESVIAERPGAIAPRLRAAELYAARGANPQRAAALFREVRDQGTVSPRDELYASSRLVDLYDGPLNEPGKALVELRRIIDRFPSSPIAAGARAALPRLKERLTADRGEG